MPERDWPGVAQVLEQLESKSCLYRLSHVIIQEMLQDVLKSASDAAGSLTGPQQLLEAGEPSEKELLRMWDSLVVRAHEVLWESKVQSVGAQNRRIDCSWHLKGVQVPSNTTCI